MSALLKDCQGAAVLGVLQRRQAGRETWSDKWRVARWYPGAHAGLDMDPKRYPERTQVVSEIWNENASTFRVIVLSVS